MKREEFERVRREEMRRGGWSPSQIENAIKVEVERGWVGRRSREEATRVAEGVVEARARGVLEKNLAQLTEVVKGERVVEMAKRLGLSQDDVWCEMVGLEKYSTDEVEVELEGRLPKPAEDELEVRIPEKKRRWRK